MKHKIYLVHESIEVMGDVQLQVVKAFACRRTAKKFIDNKNHKLAELKKKFEDFNPEELSMLNSKTTLAKLRRFVEIYSRNEYFVKEVELYA